ncbi:hypothetical protein BDZ45DRAFT_737787 [Acephala macrosclerotiorum]|nr:hypothetical protein BDZ45DRAFT_737787 [Acephala macrosclerotiorum]
MPAGEAEEGRLTPIARLPLYELWPMAVLGGSPVCLCPRCRNGIIAFDYCVLAFSGTRGATSQASSRKAAWHGMAWHCARICVNASSIKQALPSLVGGRGARHNGQGSHAVSREKYGQNRPHGARVDAR